MYLKEEFKFFSENIFNLHQQGKSKEEICILLNIGIHKVENYLKREVCAGRMTLKEAQQKIATDWISVYKSMK